MSSRSSMNGLVSVEWLVDNLEQVKVLDASWYLPYMGRDAEKEYSARRIPGAARFDIDGKGLCDAKSSLPHMLPSAAEFSEKMNDLQISNADQVIVYASHLFMGAARAWWMFRVFSHDRVAVLDGGLDEWLSKGLPLETGEPKEFKKDKSVYFEAKLRPELVVNISQVLHNFETKHYSVIDARPDRRFNMLEDEPRPGVRRGRIPESLNIPSTQVLNGQKMKSTAELRSLFTEKLGENWNNRYWVHTCGSGATAPTVALAMWVSGHSNWAIYDGSWAEYGTTHGVPAVR